MTRPRCPAHGLIMSDEQGCIRCHHARETKKTRPLPIVLTLLVGGVLVTMLVVRVASELRRPTATREPMFTEATATLNAPPTATPNALPVATPNVPPAATPNAPPAVATHAPSTTPAALTEEQIAAEMKHVPVTLYSAAYCGWCQKAKAHMDARGIAYTELRIDESATAKREMARIGGSGIPTFDIEGDVHSGFNARWIDATVRKHAQQRIARAAR